ncbi:serine hydrolase-like protein [Cephus cinctus]|uniref:Serine hydrolase-like protein n=1 Tax=Cephus cinctus TaxID=211228 RepID=A0AAJ7C4P2_CEPCN|nr:serine hydrolase-like protein [Cephus cinctus]XP_015601363.1 serine hydrolase-like protein [Cephus cinctus]XP_015601364.1 serine hydrolase-like protein [Cephus cinctus]XP_015601365.1 serine hydrolase-like protein [Cephus cinctus]
MSHKKPNSEIRIPVPWGHIAAKTWGSPAGKRVFLSHGTLDNAGSFDRLVSLLPEHFYYVCIDLPGHGLSSHFYPGVPLDFFNYILAIKMVLDYLQWDQCSFIGHSLGGYLGIFFFVLYPDKLDKLIILESVSPFNTPKNLSFIFNRIRLMHNVASETLEDNLKPRIYNREEIIHGLKYMRQFSLLSESAEALFDRAVTQVGEDMFMYNRDARMKISILPLLNQDQVVHFFENVNIPTLVIIATASINEYYEPPSMQFCKLKNNKSYTLVVVEGNHDVHNNYPERVAPHVAKFLSGLKSNL